MDSPWPCFKKPNKKQGIWPMTIREFPQHWDFRNNTEGLQQRNSGYDRNWEANLPMTASLVGLTEKLSLEVGNTASNCAFGKESTAISSTEDWLIFVLPRWKQLITRSSSPKKISHPQIDGKVNHHEISRDLLLHLFGDDYNLGYRFFTHPHLFLGQKNPHLCPPE